MTRREQKQEAYEDALFALLMEDVIEEEGKRLLEENERLMRDPSAAVPREVDERCLKTIQRSRRGRGKERNRNVGRVAYRVFTKASVVVVICMLLFTAAFAASPALRVKTLNLLIEVSDVETILTMDSGKKQADDNVVVAEETVFVQFGYRIPVLPEGFELVNESVGDTFATLTYRDSNNRSIKFMITRTDGGEYGVDTEGARRVENVIIGNTECLFIEEDERIRIVWGDEREDLYLSVTGMGIAENVLCDIVAAMLNR